jgi:hypothetical protein
MKEETEEHKSSGGLDSTMVASAVMRAIVPNYIRVKICWHTVTSSDQPDWLFRDQKRINRSLSERIKGPQIYRFLFNVEQTPLCYIGQSGHFEDRVGDYRRELKGLRSASSTAFTLEGLAQKAKKLQSHSTIRVGSLIQLADQEDSKVELQLIDFPEFSFNRSEITLNSLSDPFRRLAMENLAILDAESLPFRVLNRGTNENAKFLIRKLRENTKRLGAAVPSGADPVVGG